MGLKKKKNLLVLTLFMVVCFIIYQLYFFLTITSEAGSALSIMDHRQFEEFREQKQNHVIVRSKSDSFINNNGVIRGVLKIHMSKYRPDNNKQFKCLKTGERIPFEQVNDDYCDCEDGTDEPSTNACVNGIFYCDTQYVNKVVPVVFVPSSQVNDGICDCCDGSDEWLHDSAKKFLSQIGVKYRHYVAQCPIKYK